jgi:Domain of unknown function (DUF4170)
MNRGPSARMSVMADILQQPKQLLHLVFGGELSSVTNIEFKNLDQVDFVGIYPNYASAYSAWKAKAQRTVDNAEMRYFIVHLHRLLDPESPVPQR